MSNDNNKQIWNKVLQVIITILTAIATTFGGNLMHGHVTKQERV